MRIQQDNANKKPNGHFNLTLHNGTENVVQYCRDSNYTDAVMTQNYHSETAWTHQQRAMMLGAFFLGHAFGFIVVGPVLSRLGVRHSITLVLLSSSIISILFPTFVTVSYRVAFVSRLLLGLIQAIHLPAFMMLWGSWAPG